ncbi:MAG: glycosyl hydrolase [Endomicrobia bacterium]|nr:glycosyl hydrolase [Endomicrobiia bacterium]
MQILILRMFETRKIIKILSAMPLLLAASLAFGFPQPSPGGEASLRSYNNATMPSARLDSLFTSTVPYPTNRWYTSLFVRPVDDANAFAYHYGNRVSPAPMSVVYDYTFPDTWTPPVNAGRGYLVGGHINQTLSANEMRANNVIAFAVQGAWGSGANDVIIATSTMMKSYNDWSFTAVQQDQTDPSRRMTTTFGKGFIFTYNYFSPGVNPRLFMRAHGGATQMTYYYNNSGTMTQITNGMSVPADRVMVKSYIVRGSPYNVTHYQYFGIYAPQNSTFTVSGNNCNISLSSTTENGRYLSVALLKSPALSDDDYGAFNIFNDYYQYAYNFITNTEVIWNYSQSQSELTTDFNFTLEAKRIGAGFAVNETVFALYPHQHKNLIGLPNKSYTYASIRGQLKVHSGNSFSTKHNFNGIVPFLTYEVPDGLPKSKLQHYISYDKTFNPAISRGENTYYYGKALARAANLITVFNQHGNLAARDDMINKLRNELSTWYKGQGSKYFGYDSVWGGIIGLPVAFGAEHFNDHHYHYGYFIYASAVLAMYDPDFALSTQYKGMVDLLVKEIANPARNDGSFPFLRSFDVYEGHSYANGRGGGNRDLGNDEESTSEAMNAWAGIYLWGLATGNQSWIDLAVYGYTTQYEAVKNYYFNMDGDIWSRTDYDRICAGILYDGGYQWNLFWTPVITQTVMGIHVMPLNQSLLYMGYDTGYAQAFYEEMWNRRDSSSGRDNFWKDIWLRFKSLYDAGGALTDWDNANLPVDFPDTWSMSSNLGDDGSSLSYSYHFIHFFNALGTVDTGYYADSPSFLVMNKDGIRTFIGYNPNKTSSSTVHFSKRAWSMGPAVPNSATMEIPPGTMAKTQDFNDFEYFTTDTSDSPPPEPVRESDTYSIYSDNFLGALWGAVGHSDRVEWYPWSNTVTSQVYSSTACIGSFEGQNYMSVRRTDAGWGAWAFTYFGGVTKDLSAYHGGTLEVSFRIDAPSPVAGGFEIGFEGTGGNQVWVSLVSSGFNQSSTTWQTVKIPLLQTTPAVNQNGAAIQITPTLLQSVTSPLIMRHNSGSSQSQWGITVYVDSILWKKANAPVLFADFRKRSDDYLAGEDKLIWDRLSSYKQENAIAEQYVEISLNSVEGNTWGVQIYTDNKGLVTNFDHSYVGSIDSATVSGLLNTFTSKEMLPMRWRPAPSSIGDYEVLLPNWQDPWCYMRDVSAFNSSTGLYSGCDEVKFMDRRGFKWNGRDYGSLDGDKKIRLYFITDFTNAKRGVFYKSNIVLEYFNE